MGQVGLASGANYGEAAQQASLQSGRRLLLSRYLLLASTLVDARPCDLAQAARGQFGRREADEHRREVRVERRARVGPGEEAERRSPDRPDKEGGGAGVRRTHPRRAPPHLQRRWSDKVSSSFVKRMMPVDCSKAHAASLILRSRSRTAVCCSRSCMPRARRSLAGSVEVPPSGWPQLDGEVVTSAIGRDTGTKR